MKTLIPVDAVNNKYVNEKTHDDLQQIKTIILMDAVNKKYVDKKIHDNLQQIKTEKRISLTEYGDIDAEKRKICNVRDPSDAANNEFVAYRIFLKDHKTHLKNKVENEILNGM